MKLSLLCTWQKTFCYFFRGADIEAKDNCYRTPFLTCLESAPSDNNYKIIRMLVEHSANTNTSDKNDKTALISAAIANNVKALKVSI